MMRKLGDVMRVFAWCLVGAGLVIGSISVSYDLRNNDARGGLDPARIVDRTPRVSVD